MAHRLVGDGDEAIALSHQVAEQRRRTLGSAHPDTLSSRLALALTLVEVTGDSERAMTLLTAAIDDAQRIHGPHHTHTIALLECRGALALQAW